MPKRQNKTKIVAKLDANSKSQKENDLRNKRGAKPKKQIVKKNLNFGSKRKTRQDAQKKQEQDKKISETLDITKEYADKDIEVSNHESKNGSEYSPNLANTQVPIDANFRQKTRSGKKKEQMEEPKTKKRNLRKRKAAQKQKKVEKQWQDDQIKEDSSDVETDKKDATYSPIAQQKKKNLKALQSSQQPAIVEDQVMADQQQKELGPLISMEEQSLLQQHPPNTQVPIKPAKPDYENAEMKEAASQMDPKRNKEILQKLNQIIKTKSNQNNQTRNFGGDASQMQRGSSKVVQKINYDDHFQKNEKQALKSKQMRPSQKLDGAKQNNELESINLKSISKSQTNLGITKKIAVGQLSDQNIQQKINDLLSQINFQTESNQQDTDINTNQIANLNLKGFDLDAITDHTVKDKINQLTQLFNHNQGNPSQFTNILGHQQQSQKVKADKKQQKENKKNTSNNSFIQRYHIVKEAGKGAFGSVFMAQDNNKVNLSANDPDKYVAIKKLFYDRRYEQRELSTLDEIKKKHLCRNIIELRDRYFQNIEEPDTKDRMVSKEYLFIVTDYLPYTICDLRVNSVFYQNDTSFVHQANSPNNYALESIKQVMFGLFHGLKDLHSIGITHRDIKLSNILMDNNYYPVTRIKICDLGSSKKLISNPNDESTQSLNYIGTRSFRAPELLVGNRFYNTKIDIWSTGIVFLKLILRYLNKRATLFEAKNTNNLCKIIMENIGEPTRVELKEMGATCNLMDNGIKAGLTDDEIMKRRFKKLDGIMKNQIPQQCVDLLHQIFQLSPLRRITAEQAIQHPYFKSLLTNEKKVAVQGKLSIIKNRTTEATSPCISNINKE